MLPNTTISTGFSLAFDKGTCGDKNLEYDRCKTILNCGYPGSSNINTTEITSDPQILETQATGKGLAAISVTIS